jgi:energy-coupling factor transport system substrate-specific component
LNAPRIELHQQSDRLQQVLLAGISLVGVAAFLYPFVLSAANDAGVETSAHASDAPFLFALVTGVCLLASLLATADDQTGSGRAKTVALLGVLVAFDATLRLVPGVLGASPIFPLIILVGAVFGATFGFQMGAITVLLSAFLTGGIGPWLPFQMFAAAWIGLTAGWLPKPRSMRLRVIVIAAFGAVWGIAFGAIMNLWFWPLSSPGLDVDAGLYWNPDLGFRETLDRYIRFYLTTSLTFDLTRAVANVVLIAFLGAPVLRLLERYRARFTWQPWEEFPSSKQTQLRGGKRA